MKQIIKSGLRIVPRRIRNFSYVKYFGAAPITNDDFILPTLGVRDQITSDFCMAFSATELREDTERVLLSPEWLFARAKKREGRPDTFGADPYAIFDVVIKEGHVEQQLVPLSLATHGRDVCADWNNYPATLAESAYIHKAKSYFEVDGGKDLFDSIRGILFREKRSVVVGTYWQSDWTYASGGIIPEYINNEKVNPHAFVIKGQKNINGKLYLVIKNSYGELFGDKGYYYIPRSQVNKFFWAFAILDADPDEVKKQTWTLLQKLANILAKMLASFKTNQIILKTTQPMPEPIQQEPKEYDEMNTMQKESFTRSERLHKEAVSALGTDVSPRDIAPDTLGCAESVSNLIQRIIGDFPIITGTWSLMNKFIHDDRFSAVFGTPEPGDIIICATGTGNGVIKNGHVGIMNSGTTIMSNDSESGLWKENFTLEHWNSYFRDKGGFKVHIYRLKAE